MNETNPCVVLLGKTGDLIGMLPALKMVNWIDKPFVMVNAQFASVLDGVSYVTPWPVHFNWPTQVTQAREAAQQHFKHVVVPQFWNDSVPFSQPAGGQIVDFNGKKWRFDLTSWPNCQAAMAGIMGVQLKEFQSSLVDFDQRNAKRERDLASTVSNWKKPVILFNLEGESCPFGYAPEIVKVLQPLRHLFDLVDLSKIKAERVYDLLGLYDRAACLITVDTATLHLAGAGNIPYVAFTNDGWSRAQPKGKCVLEISYSKTLEQLWQLPEICSHLAEQKAGKKVTVHYDVDNPPSVLHQTPWPVRILDDLPTNSEYLNCGLLERDGKRFLVPRRVKAQHGQPFGFNDCVAFEMKGRKIIGPELDIKFIHTVPGEHFEDPRIFVHENRTWMSCCNFVWGKTWTGAHQVLMELNNDWVVTRRFDVAFGKNGNSVWGNTGMEKNWLWFFHDGQPHLIYLTEPHVVVQMSHTFNPVRPYETNSSNIVWPWGQPRGGTPPVRIGDEYFSFFHSSSRWHETGSARYHMGFYAFEAKPPFRKTRIIKMPIMSGSSHDRWGHPKPITVFACGAVINKGIWTVSFGINDLYCGVADIPHDDLLKDMVELK